MEKLPITWGDRLTAFDLKCAYGQFVYIAGIGEIPAPFVLASTSIVEGTATLERLVGDDVQRVTLPADRILFPYVIQ